MDSLTTLVNSWVSLAQGIVASIGTLALLVAFVYRIVAVDPRSAYEAKRWIGRIVVGTIGRGARRDAHSRAARHHPDRHALRAVWAWRLIGGAPPRPRGADRPAAERVLVQRAQRRPHRCSIATSSAPWTCRGRDRSR